MDKLTRELIFGRGFLFGDFSNYDTNSSTDNIIDVTFEEIKN